jgi:hypothetical protein
MKAFGVGCFHFALKDNMEKEITVQDYINEIKRSLQKLTTASEFELDFDKSIRDVKINTSAPNPKINNGEPCYPAIDFLNLSFNLYIPSRIQAELIKVSENSLDTETERFKITIRNEWHGPVSYIECLSARDNTQPSTAVQVVREFLITEFSKIDTFLTFDFLGPSPFHADFYLQNQSPQDEKQTKFTLEEIKSPAYNTLAFKYTDTNYSNEEEALEELFDAISDELSFYYELEREARHNLKIWMEIQETTNAILHHEEHKKWRHLPKRLIEKPKLFKKAFKDIGLFKGHQIFAKGRMETNYASIYKNGKAEHHLKSYVDQLIAENTQYPLNETSELIKYFDQKSSKTVELVTIVSAAILGGMAGSILTTAFGK